MYTSECQIIPIVGTNAMRRRHYVAPAGSQIVGLQFVGSKLTGIYLERVFNNKGSVASICGMVGNAVDRISMTLRSGQVMDYGEIGGTPTEPCNLDEDELIVVVEQARRDAFLGNSVIFCTSKGRIVRIAGMQAMRS